MGLGTRANPSTAAEGIWFPHRTVAGAPIGSNVHIPDRVHGTTTGRMLANPFSEKALEPPVLPVRFYSRWEDNYKYSNKFSHHDNRDAHRTIHFRDGQDERLVGKKNYPYNRHLHCGDYDGQLQFPADYTTSYNASFKGEPAAERPIHYRFPKEHSSPLTGCCSPSTTTLKWFKPTIPPYRNSTQELANTQEPRIKPSQWKYSYKSLSRAYPKFDYGKIDQYTSKITTRS